MDFTPDNAGNPPFPHDLVINPYQQQPFLEWTTGDWDSALRFWTLPYDPHLHEWLNATDPSLPSILAAREFGGQPDRWQFDRAGLEALGWGEADDFKWQPDRDGWAHVLVELEELKMLMQDDRNRYLKESDEQADGLADYMIAFIGASSGRHPWTIELVSCGLAIGNIAYMHYKALFKRVRPSVLCPGLVSPFGPPAHPSFPSGHSFLGHLIALLLLEIPAISQRYGVFDDPSQALNGGIGRAPGWADLNTNLPIPSPLLWLSQRLAKNRERIGVHYPSDSSFSRHLAAGIWDALFKGANPNGPSAPSIICPTLETVLDRATAEWPTDWWYPGPGVCDGPAVTLVESGVGYSATCTLMVTGVDTGNLASATVVAVATAGNDTDPATPGNAALLAMMTAAADPLASDSLSWTFSAGAAAFNYLDEGESLVLTYTVTATDNTGATASKPVTVTIIGTG